ncbi:MAG TPA: hypothetical protein VF527_20440 [Pyrinomonadaceae bacterium]|jgi:hypothetical protein
MSTKRLFFFCAEYARRRPRPVQAVGASQSVHILGFAIQTVEEDFEALVGDLRERGLRDTQERPDEWMHVATTYREVERGELAMMYREVVGGDVVDEDGGRPKEVFPDSFGSDGEPLFDGRPVTMTTPVERKDEDDDPSVA